MVHGQMDKGLIVIGPDAATIASTFTTTAQIDTLGFDYCQVEFQLDNDTTAMTALKLTESESSESATSGDDITEFVGGGVGGFSFPASAAATKLVRFNVDCRKRMRYLGVVMTSGDATGSYTCTARLSRAHTIPSTAAGAGLTALVTA